MAVNIAQDTLFLARVNLIVIDPSTQNISVLHRLPVDSHNIPVIDSQNSS